VAAGEVELGPDVAGKCVGRLAIRRQLRQCVVPFADKVADDRLIDRLLVPEIVVDIGLRQVSTPGDLGDAGAVEAFSRKMVIAASRIAFLLRARILRSTGSGTVLLAATS